MHVTVFTSGVPYKSGVTVIAKTACSTIKFMVVL